MNVLSKNKQTTIGTLLAMGKSQHEIARVTGIDRKTVRAYQQRAAAANSPGVATGSAKPAASQTPPPRPPAQASACEPWRAFIEEQVARRRNAMAIYQDLVDLHGFGHGYNSVKRFVGRLRVCEPEQFDRLAALISLCHRLSLYRCVAAPRIKDADLPLHGFTPSLERDKQHGKRGHPWKCSWPPR